MGGHSGLLSRTFIRSAPSIKSIRSLSVLQFVLRSISESFSPSNPPAKDKIRRRNESPRPCSRRRVTPLRCYRTGGPLHPWQQLLRFGADQPWYVITDKILPLTSLLITNQITGWDKAGLYPDAVYYCSSSAVVEKAKICGNGCFGPTAHCG